MHSVNLKKSKNKPLNIDLLKKTRLHSAIFGHKKSRRAPALLSVSFLSANISFDSPSEYPLSSPSAADKYKSAGLIR